MPLETIDVETAPATIYTLPATESNSVVPPLIYFIPGNPGVVGYYIEFLDKLSELVPKYEILATSQAGNHVSSKLTEARDKTRRVYTLDEQIDHKIEVLLHYTQGKPRDVYILGHSVGAWMAQRIILKAPAHLTFRFAGLLTPTVVDIALSPNGMKLVKFGGFFGPMIWLYHILIRAMPVFMLNKLISFFIDSSGVDVTIQQLREPANLEQIFYMGREEMIRIGPDDSAVREFWHNRRCKIWLFFGPKDHWVAESTKHRLVTEYGDLPNVDILDYPGHVSHSFCVQGKEQIGIVAAETSRAILSGATSAI